MTVRYNFMRYEKKYILNKGLQKRFLDDIASRIRRDEFGRYTICNLYYDTEDDRLIRTSLEKPVYKEKLRMRSYGVPKPEDQVFIELKKKYEGVVYKRRTSMNARKAAAYLHEGEVPEAEDQVCREINHFMRYYEPSPNVFIAYDREAYAGLEDPELRITFDTGLRWRDYDLDLTAGDYGEALMDEDFVLMEIKVGGALPIWLAKTLSKEGIFPGSFSKYGTCYREKLLEKHRAVLMSRLSPKLVKAKEAEDSELSQAAEPLRRLSA